MHFQKYAFQSAEYGDGSPDPRFSSGFPDTPSGTGGIAMAASKLPEKLYRMAEVMEHSGLSRQTLHYYATLGLIREKKRTASGYRLFPPTVFRDLDRVKKLQKKGFTLREIREKLATPGTNRG